MLLQRCCISFDSYIKPQPLRLYGNRRWVVYLLIPTSNHNYAIKKIRLKIVVYLLIPTSNHNNAKVADSNSKVVYLLIPTSNHNYCSRVTAQTLVVYLLIPTSNHNSEVSKTDEGELYIF